MPNTLHLEMTKLQTGGHSDSQRILPDITNKHNSLGTPHFLLKLCCLDNRTGKKAAVVGLLCLPDECSSVYPGERNDLRKSREQSTTKVFDTSWDFGLVQLGLSIFTCNWKEQCLMAWCCQVLQVALCWKEMFYHKVSQCIFVKALSTVKVQ